MSFIVTELPRSILQGKKIKPLSSTPSLLDLRSLFPSFVPSSQALTLAESGVYFNHKQSKNQGVTGLEHFYKEQLMGPGNNSGPGYIILCKNS